jgi:tagaturonate epimerase
VLDDATWGTFQAGWRGGVGADADHLKTPVDIDACAAAGFTFYTIDPGAYVDSDVDVASPEDVRRKVDALPWQELESSPSDLQRVYAGHGMSLDDREIALDTSAVLRAAAKYGRAVAHVAAMYRHLAAKGIPFDLEVSVDETETPTTHGEHVYIAGELKRLGVRWVSLAPRYVGHFEKGVDYIGDLEALRADLAGHAAIARALGPYKLSLHSGSDKFSVYPIIAELAEGRVHLKTAGTSYLEALRVVAQVDPALFREILAFGREHYEQDRASYHVSAEVRRVPAPADLLDARLPDLLEDFDARQVLHVTFGSTLARFGSQLKAVLQAHEENYSATLERHFVRHLEPFAWAGT